MKQGLEYKKIKDICDKGSSNIQQNKIVGTSGEYPVYGASGYVQNIDFYHQENPYIGIVKDGSGVGRVNVYPAKTSLLGTMQYIIPKHGVSLGYVAYALKGLNLAKFASGAAIPHIYFRDYGECLIPVPSIEEQKAICLLLDKLNRVIEAKKEQLKELDKLAQSLFYDIFGDIDTILSRWETKTMVDVCSNIVDCPHSTPVKSEVPTDYPCIRTSELKGGYIHWGSMQYGSKEEYEKRITRLTPQCGDIVYGREGVFGDAVILPQGWHFCLGQRTMLFRANNEIVCTNYLHRVLISDVVLRQAQNKNVASTVAHVNVKDIKQFVLPIPPMALQQAFAEKVKAIEQQKELINQSIKDVQTLFDAKMDFYFGD